jgi:phospholipase C
MRFSTWILLLVSLAATFAYAQTLPHFQHIIVVVQENRTPDNLFGSNTTFEPGVDLATAPGAVQWCLGACFDPNHTNAGWQNGYDKANWCDPHFVKTSKLPGVNLQREDSAANAHPHLSPGELRQRHLRRQRHVSVL